MRLSRRAALKLLAQLGLGLSATACTATAPPPPTPTLVVGSTVPPSRGVTPVLANSELVIGRNRVALGLIADERPLTDARVSLGFYQIMGQQATKRSETDAAFRWIDEETRGLYVATADFDQPGQWGVEVTATRAGWEPRIARLQFEVRAQGAAPMIGTPAPRSKTLTTGEVGDASEICSNAPPCALHGLSLDQALANGRPTLVLFASPGFCMTATCAPELAVVLEARARRPERANWVHVEVYKDPRNGVFADAVVEWKLASEPWVFLADAGGVIRDRFEGPATREELEESLATLA